jgi:hypothetical protein
VAGARLGSKELAPRLHDLVRRDAGYLIDVSGLVAPFDPPEGSPASHAAAHITGASFGTGTSANRQAYYRIRADGSTSSSPPFQVQLTREELI